jgi:NADH-quinone oxidoreductase subunit C
VSSLEHGFAIATGGSVTVAADDAGTPVIDVPVTAWREAAAHARADLGMNFLDWLSAVDQPDGDPAGVDVLLHVASVAPGTELRRLLLRTRVPETALQVPSLTSLWPGVAWHERETFEMFGVVFTDFDDGTGQGLRPLLLPEGFEGTPLRKSFVLAARAAKAWPGAKDPADAPGKAPSRRKMQPPGVPDPSWGPREPGAEPPPAVAERPVRRPPRRPAPKTPGESS